MDENKLEDWNEFWWTIEDEFFILASILNTTLSMFMLGVIFCSLVLSLEKGGTLYMLVTNIRFSHFIINGSTIYTSWIIPDPQHAALDPRVNEKWAVVRNEQEFSHFDRQMWVKKLVQGNRIRINTWNIGYLTRKLM